MADGAVWLYSQFKQFLEVTFESATPCMQASSAALQDQLGNRGCYLMLERQSGVAIDQQHDK